MQFCLQLVRLKPDRLAPWSKMMSPSLRVRFRVAAEDGSDQPQFATRTGWSPERAAVVICDMWDTHHCVSAANRVAEMALHLNKVVAGMRRMGALIIHSPSSCMDFYGGHPARKRATEARHVDAPACWSLPGQQTAMRCSTKAKMSLTRD